MASVVNWIRLEDDIGEHLRPLLINEVKVEFGHSSQISAVNCSIRVLYWPRQAPDWLVEAIKISVREVSRFGGHPCRVGLFALSLRGHLREAERIPMQLNQYLRWCGERNGVYFAPSLIDCCERNVDSWRFVSCWAESNWECATVVDLSFRS